MQNLITLGHLFCHSKCSIVWFSPNKIIRGQENMQDIFWNINCDISWLSQKSVLNRQITFHPFENREDVSHNLDFVLVTYWFWIKISISERLGIEQQIESSLSIGFDFGFARNFGFWTIVLSLYSKRRLSVAIGKFETDLAGWMNATFS